MRLTLLLSVLLLVACGAGADWGPFRTPNLSKLSEAQLNDFVDKLEADERNFSAERRDLSLSTRVDVTVSADARTNFSGQQWFFSRDAAKTWSLFATVARLEEEQLDRVGKWQVDTSAARVGEIVWKKLDAESRSDEILIIVPLICNDGISRFAVASKELSSTMLYLIETDAIGALMAVMDRDR